MVELLEEIYIIEDNLIHETNILSDLESILIEDVTKPSATLFCHNLLDMERKYGLDLKLADLENLDIISKYNYDNEALSDFLNRLMEKIDRLKTKFDLFVKKVFLKMLNLVSSRTSIIDNLLEDLPSYAKNQNISLGLSKKIGVLTGKVYKEYSLENPINIRKVFKTFEEYYETNKDAEASIKELGNDGILNAFRKNAKKALTEDMKKDSLIVRVDTKIYTVEVNDRGDIVKTLRKINFKDKIKHNDGKTIENMLIKAKEANEEFNINVDDVFSILKDIDDVEVRLDGKDDGEINKFARQQAKKFYSNIKLITPWIAFHSVLHVYNHIGYTIAVAKEFSKESK